MLYRVAAEEAEELLRSREEAYRPTARVSPAYQVEGGQLVRAALVIYVKWGSAVFVNSVLN